MVLKALLNRNDSDWKSSLSIRQGDLLLKTSLCTVPPFYVKVDIDSSLYPRRIEADDNEEEEFVDAEGDISGRDSALTPVDNIQAVMDKVSFYSNKLYEYARKEDEVKAEGERAIRKYSRKLRRLMKRFRESQQGTPL